MSTFHIDRLLDTVIRQEASDLHLAVGKPPSVRMRGRLIELKTRKLEPADTTSLMKAITPERSQTELQEEGGSDFGFAYGDQDDPENSARFRVSIFKQKGNISLVLRRIPNKLMDIDVIGLPPIVKDLIRRPRGLFLVTGPTGSGKTTTLASMINHVNMTMDRHIITVEDPIEYYQPHKQSIVNQREVGVDVPSFSEALRRALRQDPDVILVGEMRDLETIEAAITASETGHLVFGTLHTSGAASTINRIIDAFPVNQQAQIRIQLSTALMAVLSQSLLKRVDKKGMVAAYEFMVVTPGIAHMIRDNKSFRIDSMIQTGRKFGMQLLDDHLWSMYEKGMVSAEDMVDRAKNPEQLVEKVHRAGGQIGRPELDEQDGSDAAAGAA
ncbi:MAG: type IV pilus twitching motility protein PilT [Phycisphaeraceae bacterium]